MEIVVNSSTSTTESDGFVAPANFGEFNDRFLREGGEWKFLERRGSIQMKFFGTTAP